jgi:hypothetical protein
MRNCKVSVLLFVAALCLFSACSAEPKDDGLPSVDVSAPGPSDLPALAADVSPVDSKKQALDLFGRAVAKLPDVMEALDKSGGEYDGDLSVRGSSAARFAYSQDIGPYEYHNDKTIIPGASVTGYFKGNFKMVQKNDEKPSPGDYVETYTDSQFEVDLLKGMIKDGISIKGRIAAAVEVTMRMTNGSDDFSIAYTIDEKMVYALTVTDTVKNVGGKFILELAAKGKFESDPGNVSGKPDLSGLNIRATLEVYNEDNEKLYAIDLKEEGDILDYLTGGIH